MKLKIRLAVWTAFWLSALLGLMYIPYLSENGARDVYVIITASIIGLCLGIAALIVSGWSLRSIILVILGLIIGQWNLLPDLLTFAAWSIGGYQP